VNDLETTLTDLETEPLTVNGLEMTSADLEAESFTVNDLETTLTNLEAEPDDVLWCVGVYRCQHSRVLLLQLLQTQPQIT